ncbi:hypothetical protein H5410_046835 [Solanum commersonii]|uniref:Putative plant transposon protein domain-containing protein n=1 Tax=Solanum commersonii TaxID=4109 RepID=A0A9J5XDB8_SOLCO|nr:hypothetical protein H5410_046835 [Solanum commersonii]
MVGTNIDEQPRKRVQGITINEGGSNPPKKESNTIIPSQNESIMCHAKAACLGSIMSRRSIDLGLLSVQEMAMRAKQKHTSLPFPVLITELYQCAGVTRNDARDFEYTREEADRRKAAPVDPRRWTLIQYLQRHLCLLRPSRTSVPPSSSQSPCTSSSSQQTKITQAMILKMGNPAYSANVRATLLERYVPLMIEATILATLTPLQTSMDTLTTRVKAYESRHAGNSEILSLKVKVAELKKDVDYLKSTDFNLFIGVADDLDAPQTSEMPLATTGDVLMDEITNDESNAKIDEEQIAIQEKSIYRDLPDLAKAKGAMVNVVMQASLADTPLAVSSGAGTSEVTLGTDAQIQTDALGTDAQTDGAAA